MTSKLLAVVQLMPVKPTVKSISSQSLSQWETVSPVPALTHLTSHFTWLTSHHISHVAHLAYFTSHFTCGLPGTYQFLNRQVLRPGTWDFLLDSVSCVVGWMIFGNFYIRSTRSFKDKLIWRLGRGTKWGTQNRVKYAWYQKNKGTLLSQLFMKFVKMQ